MVVRLLTDIHNNIPANYEKECPHRVKAEPRHYWHQAAFRDGKRRHLFAFEVDDTTSPDNLILVSVRHAVR
jgi:hypothetical protein